MDNDLEKRISQASKAIGTLRKAVFLDRNLSLKTKRKIYRVCVLPVLMYGSECWTPLKRHCRKINTFHHRCIKVILGITNQMQWTQHITMREVRRKWDDSETAKTKLTVCRLMWVGHFARIPDHRLPKTALFGWLPQPRPRCGLRTRWREVIKKDLKEVGVDEKEWYTLATTSREEWRSKCRSGLEILLKPQNMQQEKQTI